MNILVIGNLGYVGPEVVKHISINRADWKIFGYDIGFFMKLNTTPGFPSDSLLTCQFYGDVRNFNYELLNNIDSIVYLAAISNDPIGNKFEKPTLEINFSSCIKIAEEARKRKVKSFVFASSCSVYGINEGSHKTESDKLNPLTAYATSKISAENELEKLAADDFQITCLRFATACGISDRLRLDLVLNDFVASAIVSKKIEILSDGSPYRPLINVKDMALAIEWACNRNTGNCFESINVGRNDWNYQIKDLAYAVKDFIKDVEISLNVDAPVDKRSYQVDFTKFSSLAPKYTPRYSIEKTISELVTGLKKLKFNDKNFREGDMIRLNVISGLISNKFIDQNLKLLK
jgi:nucleoside-diphosphate-sugar epimerase